MNFNHAKIVLAKALLITLVLSLLSACGGGGGGGGGAAGASAAISSQPTDQSVVIGTTANFTVVATDATGYQWQSSTDGGTTFANVSGATATSCTTAATIQADDGTRYRVVVSGSSNSVTSSAVTLTVTAAPVLPSISVQPAGQTITEGQNASFSITAAGTSLSYQWQRSTDAGASFTDVAGETGATLTLTAVPLASDAHQFRVMVSNSAGSVTSNAATLSVTPAQVSPAFSTQPASQSVVAPNAATFNVAVTGSPMPTLQWQLSTNAGGTFADIAGATGSSYTTAATGAGDNGNQYRVIATNTAGTINSNAATLTVTVPSIPSFTTQPTDVTVTEGQNAQFTVVVSGVPTPALQWQLSTDSGGAWNNINGATGTTLDLAGVALANNGRQFRAVATNGSGGIDSNAALLTVLPRTWGTAGLLETDSSDAYGPKIAIDANGNALAVWLQDGDTTPAGYRYDVWARRYSAGVWGTATLIETNNAGSVSDDLQLAYDADGNAIAVWSQSSASAVNIWSNRYTAGVGWGTATLVGLDSAVDFTPQIAIDASGNVLVVWIHTDTTYHIWANRYTAGTGWGTAAAIETNTADGADAPQIVIDANGNATAVWAQSSVGNIWANRYTAGTGWGTAALIETGTGSAYGPRIAIDAGGNVLAVWAQTNGTVYSVWSNRYSAGAWGTAALIETDNAGSAEGPQIAIDANGNALAVWAQSNGTVISIWANRFSAGVWGTAQLIETDSGSNAGYPEIAFDANGNALAVWHQPRAITYNRYTNGIGWGTAALVDPDINNEVTGPPQIAIDGNGNAWVVWAQYDFTRNNIWANRYQ